jgi:LacI family transcriptional regulator
MPRSEVTHIGLLADVGTCYGRGLVRGVYTYAADNHLRWYFHTLQQGIAELDDLTSRRGVRGVIAYVSDAALLGALKRLNIPAVNVGGALRDASGIARVMLDNVEIGRMAARHLLEAGFRRFGFIGIPGFAVSELREAGFREVLAKAGYTYARRDHRTPRFDQTEWEAGWPVDDARLRDWLLEQEFPIAIFVNHDQPLLRVSGVCRLSGIRVPEDVALLGADNDEIICNLAYPPLSSIDTGPVHVGYTAASVLAGLMEGRQPENQIILLPPVRVVVRGSSERAHDDPVMNTALRYIREHAHEQIDVERVAEHALVTRRTLERLFKRELGRSVLREITRVRIDLAKGQLRTTSNSIGHIAAHCGFLTPQRFCEVFRLSTGLTPGAYREDSRAVGFPADKRSESRVAPCVRKGRGKVTRLRKGQAVR